MVRIIEEKIYSYNELCDDAKERAINKFIENNEYDTLPDDLYNMTLCELEERGIKTGDNFRVYYSLGYSQGDGLCFVGNFEYHDYIIKVKPSGGMYNHKYSTHFEFYDNELNPVDDSEDFKRVYYDICDKMEKAGYEIIEYEQTEEFIEDFFNANEIEFYHNGDIY